MAGRLDIEDVTVLDGQIAPDGQVIIVTIDTARTALVEGATAELLEAGVRALTLSGKPVVFLNAEPAT